MKKILLFCLLIILIPILIVNTFIKNEEIKFEYTNKIMIRVKRTNNVIEKIPLEEYIVGVLAGEMPLYFHEEALKAQAVAARTYALKKMQTNYNNAYDVVDTVQNQVYLDDEYLKSVWQTNYTENINKLRKIVISTNGEYISYNNEIIEAFYFSTSPGITENSEDVFDSYLPYLRSVSSKWDNISPVFEESKIYTLNDFYSLLNIAFSSTLNISNLKQTSTGRILKVSINGTIFSSSTIVNNLKLRSSFFEITQLNNSVIIKTKGYGHGVGMSQYGAQAMSNNGYNYQEIIKYYYKDVEILNL